MSGRLASTTVNSMFIKINHSNSRGYFAFSPDVKRHESSERLSEKLFISIISRIYQNGSANIRQKKDWKLQWCWTKVGQSVQLGVNVFLAYPTLKYLRWSGIERHIYQKTLSQIHSPRQRSAKPPTPHNTAIFLLAPEVISFISTVKTVNTNMPISCKTQLIVEKLYSAHIYDVLPQLSHSVRHVWLQILR